MNVPYDSSYKISCTVGNKYGYSVQLHKNIQFIEYGNNITRICYNLYEKNISKRFLYVELVVVGPGWWEGGMEKMDMNPYYLALIWR